MDSYFWFGEVLNDFLFKGLNTKSWGGILGVCAALVCLSFLYEGLNKLKQYFLNRFLKARKQQRRKSHDDVVSRGVPSLSSSRPFLSRRRTNNIPDNGGGEPAPRRSLLEESDNHNEVQKRSVNGGFVDLGVSSILHSLYIFIGFSLMNAVMTFNTWVLFSISIGIAIGYFCFGNFRRRDILMNPLETETTSLNEDSTTPPIMDGAGDRDTSNPYFGQFEVPDPVVRNADGEDPNESSKLIVGAQVHTPRIMSSSFTSTGST